MLEVASQTSVLRTPRVFEKPITTNDYPHEKAFMKKEEVKKEKVVK